MDNTIIKIIVALFALILTPIGFLIGNVRYKKFKDELWEQIYYRFDVVILCI